MTRRAFFGPGIGMGALLDGSGQICLEVETGAGFLGSRCGPLAGKGSVEFGFSLMSPRAPTSFRTLSIQGLCQTNPQGQVNGEKGLPLMKQ